VKHLDAIILIVNIVSLLHDVADHKYIEEDPSLDEKVIIFLTKLTTNPPYTKQFKGTIVEQLFDVGIIKGIIDRISFSRQKKYGTVDWYLLGMWGVLIRNIVSDADKFEAMNIKRCEDYTRELFTKQNKSCDDISIRNAVVQHYHEKLKLLATSEYMKTFPGWIYAQMYLDPQMQKSLRIYNK